MLKASSLVTFKVLDMCIIYKEMPLALLAVSMVMNLAALPQEVKSTKLLQIINLLKETNIRLILSNMIALQIRKLSQYFKLNIKFNLRLTLILD